MKIGNIRIFPVTTMKVNFGPFTLVYIDIDHFQWLDIPETNKLDTLSGNAPLATGDIILTEVLQGFRREKTTK